MLAITGCGFVGITLWYFGRDLPDYQQLAHYEPSIMTRVHAGDGRLLAEYATERRIFVPIQAIPKPVINAFLSAEDKNFYNHHGVDPVSILRAAITDVSRFRANRRPVGASTITQQVAKNMLLSNEVSIERKIKEILLATRIEAALPKERILELYLNEIYLGSGAYGVAAAALTYFDKSLDELTLGEAAFLAGLPKAPNRYSPTRFPQTAKARRDWVLERMVEDGAATQAEAAQAEAQPLELRHRQDAEEVRAPYFAEEVRRDLLARYGEKVLYGAGLSVRTSLDERLQAASDKALRAGLIAYEHSHGGWRGAIARIDPKGDWAAHLAAVPVPGVATDVGWRLAMVVRSEPDGAVIGFANGASGRIPFSEMRWARPRYDNGSFGPRPRGAADVVKPGDVVMVEPISASSKAEASGTKPADLYTLCQVPEVSGALVAMDPHTGRVLAISGGFSFATSQFDRATQAKRQPGSSIKPFIYLTALDHGFTPSTLVVDGPISLPQGPGLPMWSPTNYTKRGQEVRFRGPTPLRVALEQSLERGDSAGRLDNRNGVDRRDRRALRHHGSYAARILDGARRRRDDLAAAHGGLCNAGQWRQAHYPDVYRSGAGSQRRDDLSRRSAPVRRLRRCRVGPSAGAGHPGYARAGRRSRARPIQIVTMLQGVVERGTAKVVQAVGKPIAGKTGTTNDWRDAWFVGFTPDLAAGVYIGFDDPDSLGDDETGGHIAAPVFRDFMIAALKDAPATAFRTPPGMRLYRVSAATGLPAGAGEPAIYEAYKPGTEPGHNRNLGLQHVPDEDETPIASTGGMDAGETNAARRCAGLRPAARAAYIKYESDSTIRSSE